MKFRSLGNFLTETISWLALSAASARPAQKRRRVSFIVAGTIAQFTLFASSVRGTCVPSGGPYSCQVVHSATYDWCDEWSSSRCDDSYVVHPNYQYHKVGYRYNCSSTSQSGFYSSGVCCDPVFQSGCCFNLASGPGSDCSSWL